MKRKNKLNRATGAINAGIDAHLDIPKNTIITIGATVIVCAVIIIALNFLSAYLKKNLL